MFCLILVSAGTWAEERKTGPEADSSFPENIVVEYNSEALGLQLTGLTMRRKFFLNIYSMAHYIQPTIATTRDAVYENILSHEGARQISMVFKRELTASQVRKSLLQGIHMNTNDAEFDAISQDVDTFMHTIYQDVKKDDEFILRWFADGTLVSLFQGTEISSIKNDIFARTMWLIWFGEHSVVNRKTLVRDLLPAI